RRPRPLEHAPALGVRLGRVSPIGARRGRGRPLQPPRGQRGTGGRRGGRLEEPPPIHFSAESGLIHVASPPLGWRAATVRAWSDDRQPKVEGPRVHPGTGQPLRFLGQSCITCPSIATSPTS